MMTGGTGSAIVVAEPAVDAGVSKGGTGGISDMPIVCEIDGRSNRLENDPGGVRLAST